MHDAGQVKELAKGWGALPARYQMVVATSLAFVLCNMDKVGTQHGCITSSRTLCACIAMNSGATV